MRVTVLKKKMVFAVPAVIIICSLFFLLLRYYNHLNTGTMVMGGMLFKQNPDDEDIKLSKKDDVEKYFRPSGRPVLNDRFTARFIDNYFGKKVSEIKIPGYLLTTPEDTIINYFSILREAANTQDGKGAGCGSIGDGRAPYPIAYNFLTKSYQDKLSYKKYLETFKNILHISLVKYREVPVAENPDNIIRYFVEIETIQGSENYIANFAYYYGFIDLIDENGQYKISNIEFHEENYLCAPYHGWSYDAEASVQIKYGGWCNLIKEMYPTIQKDYIKNVAFQGTDGNDYLIVFYQLTNDNDIEIAQYIKNPDGSWKLIKLDPEKCLKDKSK